MRRSITFYMASLCIFVLATTAGAQLRIVTYNTANGTFPSGNNPSPRTGMADVLQAIGAEYVNGIARPIDVLILQEQDDPSTTTQEFVDLLDGLYGVGTYGRSTVITLPNYSTNIRQTLVYNTNTVSLIDEKAFGVTGSSAAARQTARFQLRPVGYDSNADFYVYNSHYKASGGSTNEARRLFEATTIRNDADALGQGTHAIYAGDYNMYTSSEDGYQKLLSAGNGQAFDPINTPGSWNNNFSYRHVHTQSPHDGSDGLVTGGMDDRFDFQLVTGELMDNEGMSYIPGSYRAFGNNGTTYNQAVNAPSNTYPVAPGVLDALAHVSDHLPVVADYQLPARMFVETYGTDVASIVGAAATADVFIKNATSYHGGFDELDYDVTTSGALSGTQSGTLLPGQHTGYAFNVDTSTVGSFASNLSVNSTSQGAANASYSEDFNALVLDPAGASFAAGSDEDVLTIDFGTIENGGIGLIDIAFDLYNLEQTLGFTADLDLDSVFGSGDTGVLTTNLTLFSGLEAGSQHSFQASLDTSEAGAFSATYTLNLSDEDIFGETSQVLTLQLLGKVLSPLPGDLDGNGIVDLADLALVLNNWDEQPPDIPEADPNGNGIVDLADLALVLNNWDKAAPAPGGLSSVPEPGTALLLGLVGLSLIRRR